MTPTGSDDSDKPSISQLMLHAPFCPRSMLFYPEGLHPLITKERGLDDFMWKYVEKYELLTNRKLPVLAWHPWGRWLPRIRVLAQAHPLWPVWPFLVTSMRMDSYRICHERKRWLVELFDKWLWTRPAHLVSIYTGSNPAMLLRTSLLTRYIDEGCELALDAFAWQQLSALTIDVERRQANGEKLRLLSEANRRMSFRMPCIAKWRLWSRSPSRFYTMDDAPEGSVVWFPAGVNTAEEWIAYDQALGYGLRVCVNLDATNDLTSFFTRFGDMGATQ